MWAGGWLSAALAFLAGAGLAQGERRSFSARALEVIASAIGCALMLMKILPSVPGHFGVAEWIALIAWFVLGATMWNLRRSSR